MSRKGTAMSAMPCLRTWNEATVLTVDYGFSSEDSGFYLNFNHMF
jgi:hypothetical protein